MAYSTYEYYTNEFHGSKIPRERYIFLSERAKEFIDSYCTCKIPTPCIEEVKKCECAICEVLNNFGIYEKQVASENESGASCNYFPDQQLEVCIYNQIKLYLMKFGYLSRVQ